MFKTYFRTIFSGLFFIATCVCATAQSEESPGYSPISLQNTWIYNISIESVGIDKKTAAEEFIKDSAWSIGIDGEYFFTPQVSTSIGIALLNYSDRAGFSANVEDTFGNRDTASSDANAVPLYAELGYRKFFDAQQRAYWSARGGYSLLISSERGIANCSNCPSEDIDVDGGIYGLAGIGYRVGNSWAIGLQYKQYFSGDLENSIGLSFLLGL